MAAPGGAPLMPDRSKALRSVTAGFRMGMSACACALAGLVTGCADRPLPTEPEVVRGVASWQTELGTRAAEPGVSVIGPAKVLVTFGTGACGGKVIRVPRSLVVRYEPAAVTISARPYDAADFCNSGEDIGYHRTLRIVLSEPIGQRRLQLL